MKKITILILIIFSITVLFAEKMTLKFTSTLTGYYPEYTAYHYESPVMGVRMNAEIYNLLERFGVGGSGLFQVKSYDDRIDYSRFYDLYVHNFFNSMQDENYFIYGFYGGVRYTKLEFEHYKTKIDTHLKMTRPLVGFVFASESWGFNISWSQAENRKPILGYEVKFRNATGVIMQIGRRNRGPMPGADSDFYIYIGYEFYM